MHKQPHRRIEKIADNTWWQNQPEALDAHRELGPPNELTQDYAPPQLTPGDAPDAEPRKR